jgi:Glycosyltransferase 61
MIKTTLKKMLSLDIKGISIDDVKQIDEEMIFPGEVFSLPERLDIFKEKHHCFSAYNCEVPPFHVRSIRNGKLSVGREEVFTADNKVIIEYTSQKSNPFIGGKKDQLDNPYRINGHVANLSLCGLEDNYYHWLTECLGRYYLLEKSRFKPDYYVLSNKFSFQKQYIEFLGIDQKKILEIAPGTIIQADEIVVPSFVNNWEPIDFRGYSHCQKQWLPRWIGNIYRERMDLNRIGERKIYISRACAGYRKIENEDKIIELLKARGYGIYQLESMLVSEQVELFANASIVLGVHGAGFGNIYFCPQNAIVCEILSEHYHDSSFKILTNALGLEYFYMIGKTSDIQDVPPYKENIYVDLKIFELALEVIESSTGKNKISL